MKSFTLLRVSRSWISARKGMSALIMTIAVLLLCLPLRSQVNTGRISGTITDQTGGAIAGAMVTVTDVERGVARTLIADGAGQYAAPNLTPGTYTVRGESKGFKALDRQNVAVDVGADVRVDLSLQPGEQTQTITVTSEAPQVNTTNAQTGGTLDNHLVQNLPLNGRNYRYEVDVLPGVAINPGGGTNDMTTNGGLLQWDNFMLDGLYSQNALNNEADAGGVGSSGDSTLVPLDAIQEITIVQNPKAEYGWFPGSTINVGLKSGTNAIHGTAYAYGRDQALDAKNAYTTPGSITPTVALEQFGGNVGGPIKKNKLFYFMAYEGVREDIASIFQNSSPTTVAGLGTGTSFPDAIAGVNSYIAGHPGTTVAVNQLSLNLAGCTNNGSTVAANISCSGNGLGFPGLFGNSTNATGGVLTRDFPNIGGSDNGLAKIDYHINDKHTANVEYYMGDYAEQVAGTAEVQPWWQTIFQTQTYEARAVEVWTPNSSWLNEARLGFDYQHQPEHSPECSTSTGLSGQPGSPNYTADYGFVSGVVTGQILACGFPATTISGFTGQLGGAGARDYYTTDLQGADSLSYTRGKHQFKFGTDIRTEAYFGAQPSEKGTIAFGATGFSAFEISAGPPAAFATPLEDFIAGTPNSESLQPPQAFLHIGFDQLAFFAQDDWRITQKLTLNLGIRWEGETSPDDTHANLGNFAPGTPTGMVQSNSLWKFQSDFTPHIGLVYDVKGKGTTVVRAGLSMANPPQFLQYYTSNGAILSNVPTGAILFEPSGATTSLAGGTIKNLISLATPGTTSSVITAPLPWAANSAIFNTTVQECGNGLAATNPTANGEPVGFVNPAPCKMYGMDPNFTLPYVTSWNLAIQHAFTNNLALNVAYVGTHGSRMLLGYDINQPTPGASGSGELLRRPFQANCPAPYGQGLNPNECYPWFSSFIYGSNVGNNNYNGLQLTLTERASRGLTFNAGYTLAHALVLGQDGDPLNAFAMNTNDLHADYGNAAFDVRDRFTFTTTYNIPERKSFAQLLQGWQINSNITVNSPFTADIYDTKFDTSGTGTDIDRWNLFGPAAPINQIMGGAGTIPCYGLATSSLVKASSSCFTVPGPGTGAFPAACVVGAEAQAPSPGSAPGAPYTSQLAQLAAVGCYAVGNSAITPPAQGTWGTMENNQLRGKGFGIWNLALTKSTIIKERITAQFRAEAFNFLNRTQRANLDGLSHESNLSSPSTFGEATSTPDVEHANPVVGSGGPREVQLSLKLIF